MRKLLLITGCCMATTISVSACGPDSTCATLWNNNKQNFQYVAVEGQQLFASLVKTTIKSLTALYNQDPQVFMQFVQTCLDDSQGILPTSFFDLLKTFNLIDSAGHITDTVKLIVSYVVEPLSNGTFKIWSLPELLAGGWASAIPSPVVPAA